MATTDTELLVGILLNETTNTEFQKLSLSSNALYRTMADTPKSAYRKGTIFSYDWVGTRTQSSEGAINIHVLFGGSCRN